ncbi:hypothetical protein HY251_13815, partial [bacterium]|nr:hypothetical protein [bacterium]
MNRPSRAGVAFLALGALMAAVVSWYNWEARAMSGILPYYEDYKRIILAGFDPAASRIGCPTFPMWGYGWVYVVTESKLAIVGFQQALGLLAAWMLVRHVERIGAPGHAGALGLLLLLSGPWFVLHSILWPYSIAASLTLMSVVLVHRGICLDEGGRLPVVLSGILFGLALNFRSDAFLMPLGLAFALWALGSPRGRAGRLALLWLACIYAMLVPWMAYTKHVSGHVLLTSTNGGANLFIGLGDLEGNKWGIVESDSDPLTHRILAEKLGPDYRMVSYDADQVLRREFLARVAEDPGEFARKCLRNLRLMWQLGAHPGEFEATAEPVTGMKGAVYSASCFMGLNVVRYSLLLLPFAAVLSCTRRRSFLVLVWLVVAYQTTLNMLGHYVPGYTNLVYVFHLLNVFLVVTCTLPQEEPAPRLEPPPS